MSNEIVFKLRTTAAAYLVAGALEKYMRDGRCEFSGEIRETIHHAARLCVDEVKEKLREELREQPAVRESLTADRRCGTGTDPEAPDFLDRCRSLARLVIARDSMPPTNPLWTGDAAEFVLTALIAFVAVCEPDGSRRHLLTVRRLLAAPGVYKAAIQAMQHVGQEGDLIRRLGQQLTWLHECDLSPVMLTLLLRTAWMESAAARLTSPDFELRRLRLDRGPALFAPARDGLAARWRRMRSRLARLTGRHLQVRKGEKGSPIV